MGEQQKGGGEKGGEGKEGMRREPSHLKMP